MNGWMAVDGVGGRLSIFGRRLFRVWGYEGMLLTAVTSESAGRCETLIAGI